MGLREHPGDPRYAAAGHPTASTAVRREDNEGQQSRQGRRQPAGPAEPTLNPRDTGGLQGQRLTRGGTQVEVTRGGSATYPLPPNVRALSPRHAPLTPPPPSFAHLRAQQPPRNPPTFAPPPQYFSPLPVLALPPPPPKP